MIKNLTPEHMRCDATSCPSLHQLEDGRLLVVGTQVEPPVATINDFANPEPFLEIAGKVGPGEAAVIISPALLDVYVAEKVASLQEEVDRLREVLKPFAEAADGYDLDCQMGDEIQGLQAANEITVGDLVRARSALSRGGGKK